MMRGVAASLCGLLVVPLVTRSAAHAQTTFERTYGDYSWNVGRSGLQTPDGGFVVAGSTVFTSPYQAFWLIRTDARGDTLWTRTFGDWDGADCLSVTKTLDGGFVLTGMVAVPGSGERQVHLVRCTASGDTVWTRMFGGDYDEWGEAVVRTVDGGYAVAGYTFSFGAGGADAWLVRTDSCGDTIWTRAYGGAQFDCGCSLAAAADSGFVIAGRTRSFGAGGFDAWVVRTDANGDTVWTRTYGGAGWDEARSVQPIADGYIVAGTTRSFGSGNEDVWLLKLNARGETTWARTYGGAGWEGASSVALTADSGCVIAGYADSVGGGLRDIWLIRADADGGTTWSRRYGGSLVDEGLSVQQTADGGYVIAGYTGSFGAGDYDAYLIKTDSLGNVGIEEPQPPVATRRPPPATICRGVLQLVADGRQLTASDAILLDVSGRKAMELAPCANDVRRVPPGIYFIVAPTTADAGPSSPQKVIVTR